MVTWARVDAEPSRPGAPAGSQLLFTRGQIFGHPGPPAPLRIKPHAAAPLCLAPGRFGGLCSCRAQAQAQDNHGSTGTTGPAAQRPTAGPRHSRHPNLAQARGLRLPQGYVTNARFGVPHHRIAVPWPAACGLLSPSPELLPQSSSLRSFTSRDTVSTRLVDPIGSLFKPPPYRISKAPEISPTPQFPQAAAAGRPAGPLCCCHSWAAHHVRTAPSTHHTSLSIPQLPTNSRSCNGRHGARYARTRERSS